MRERKETFKTGDILADRYQVTRFISSGGMGEVYEVEDLHLGVQVALKTIRQAVSDRSKARERFKREILLARSISHPNVCRIYDLGVHKTDDLEITFLTMEFLSGETLSDRLGRLGRLSVNEAAPIVIQIASALDAAHYAGVLHRDLKSSNIILEPTKSRERAVITDFGLALGFSGDWEDASRMTADGIAVGTIDYMAPEQMRGEALGPPSDIYSLGCVMYEMVTGDMPFRGKKPLQVVAKRMAQEAPSPRDAVPELDQNWEAVILRCLHRDPGARFDSAADVVKMLELPSASDVLALSVAESGSASAGHFMFSDSATRPYPWSPEPSTPIKPKFLGISRKIWPILVLTVALALAVILIWTSGERPLPRGNPLQLTDGETWDAEPAISPDGRLIAYASGRGQQSDIWIIDTRGGNPLQLTNDPYTDDSPVWYPDGSHVAYVSDRGGDYNVWKVRRLGGSSIMLIPKAVDPSISPDGSQMAFSRSTKLGKQRLFIASMDDPNAARPVTGDNDGLWEHRQPRWSPDGQTICYRDFNNLWVFSVKEGKARQLTTENGTDRYPVWSSDGRHIYFSSMREGTRALWRVPFPEGHPPERVTLGTGPEGQPSVSRDGAKLAYSTYSEITGAMFVELETGEDVRFLDRRLVGAPSFSPDGSEVVFICRQQGKSDLCKLNLNGIQPRGEPRRFTDLPSSFAVPYYSPDGEWIVGHRVLDGQRDIWMIPSQGGIPSRITSHESADVNPSWSPDGTRLAFVSERDGAQDIWIMPVHQGQPNGTPEKITDGTMQCFHPKWSPDGTRIAYTSAEESGRFELWITSLDRGSRARKITSRADVYFYSWESDNTILVNGFWQGSQLTLRRVNLESLEVAPLDISIDFGNRIETGVFHLSADGRILAGNFSERKGNIWIVDAKAGSF
ncbi:protein kinase [Acidobacteriota bacterium]